MRGLWGSAILFRIRVFKFDFKRTFAPGNVYQYYHRFIIKNPFYGSVMSRKLCVHDQLKSIQNPTSVGFFGPRNYTTATPLKHDAPTIGICYRNAGRKRKASSNPGLKSKERGSYYSSSDSYGSFPKQGDPNIDPNIPIYYSPYYWDPQKGTHNFGKPPYPTPPYSLRLRLPRFRV